MGSGRTADAERCAALGRWLAGEHVHLLTGGGGGVMAEVSRGFAEVEERAGLVIGVLPASAAGSSEPPTGYPNRWVEVAIRTHLHLSGAKGTDPASRNHINVLSADVVIALPGSLGTRSEIELAIRYGKPAVGYLTDRTSVLDIPDAVPVFSSLEPIQRFVRRALGRAP